MVNIGDTYRKVIADENCLIEVKAIDGIYVLGEVVNEPLTIGGIPLPSDHAGQEVSDLLEHVEKRVASARAWDQMTRRHNKAVKDFWESVQTGDTLHYRHFHGQFYRVPPYSRATARWPCRSPPSSETGPRTHFPEGTHAARFAPTPRCAR